MGWCCHEGTKKSLLNEEQGRSDDGPGFDNGAPNDELAILSMDGLLQRIGGTGTYQILLFFLIGTLFGCSGMLQLSFLLTGRTATLVCVEDNFKRLDFTGNDNATFHSDCTSSLACAQPTPLSQYLEPFYTFNSYAAEFGLLCHRARLNAMLTSTVYLAIAIGAPIAGTFIMRVILPRL